MVVNWEVSSSSAEVLGLDGLGWPPDHPYSGIAARAIVPHDPDWLEVGDVGSIS